MTVSGIGQLSITVSDLDASVRWYRDVLGIPHLFTVEGQPMAFLQAGDVRLYLNVTEDPRFTSRPVVYYAVDDLETTYDEVTGRGAEPVSGPHLVHRDGSTELWMAFVVDPDGIPVGLMSERPAA
jgi:catechol 2,3-dioxygenase-like lactoylglutathione lyase family enzyme